MKKYCFDVLFENVSSGYLLADTWIEAINEIIRVRKEKYPQSDQTPENDIVDIKLVGKSIEEAY